MNNPKFSHNTGSGVCIAAEDETGKNILVWVRVLKGKIIIEAGNKNEEKSVLKFSLSKGRGVATIQPE